MATRSQQNWITALEILVLVMINSWTACGVESQTKAYFSHQFNCSRYVFSYLKRKTWQQSLEACKNDNGTLVCIETKEEWSSINSKIKSSRYEWYIGLTKDEKQWKWVNGKLMNWTKEGEWPWHEGEPSHGRNVVKMWNKGGKNLFDDVLGSRTKPGYICEYTNEDFQGCKKDTPSQAPTSIAVADTTTGTQSTTTKKTTTHTSTVKTASTTPTTTRSSTSTKKTISTTTTGNTGQTSITSTSQTAQGNSDGASTQPKLNTKSIYASSSTKTSPDGKASTTSRNPTAKISADTQVQKDEFPIAYLAIALGVLLLFLVCMLIAIYCWKYKKKDKGGGSEEAGSQSQTADVSEIIKSNSFVAFKMVHNNIGDTKLPGAKLTNDATPTDGTYAEINLKRSTAVSTPPGQVVNMSENPTSSPSQDGKNVEVVYAAVDKSAKRKKATQEPQITYADLASFNNNEDTVVHMPPPYQPVQYAEIIGTKKSKK